MGNTAEENPVVDGTSKNTGADEEGKVRYKYDRFDEIKRER